MENIGTSWSFMNSIPRSRDLNPFVDLILTARNYNKSKAELDLENDGIVCYTLLLNTEGSSQCPKMSSEYLKGDFNDRVANTVWVFQNKSLNKRHK